MRRQQIIFRYVASRAFLSSGGSKDVQLIVGPIADQRHGVGRTVMKRGTVTVTPVVVTMPCHILPVKPHAHTQV